MNLSLAPLVAVAIFPDSQRDMRDTKGGWLYCRELGCSCEKAGAAAGDEASPLKRYKVTLLQPGTAQPPRTLTDCFPKLAIGRARAKK